MSSASRAKNRHNFIMNLCSAEVGALSLLKDINVATIDPIIVKTNTDTLRYWNYWRFVLSSEDQTHKIGSGRVNNYFMFDKTSGGLLGLFAITDTAIDDFFLRDRWCWGEHDIVKTRGIRNSTQKRTRPSAKCLSRCIPLYEFGTLLGGKLLTLSAMSTELIRSLEITYSFKLSVLYTIALHGKSSQYNRLNNNGLNFEGVSVTDAGYYIKELRKGGENYLSGKKKTLGKLKTDSFAINCTDWKERWFLPRAESLKIKTITFDKSKYSLEQKIRRV